VSLTVDTLRSLHLSAYVSESLSNVPVLLLFHTIFFDLTILPRLKIQYQLNEHLQIIILSLNKQLSFQGGILLCVDCVLNLN